MVVYVYHDNDRGFHCDNGHLLLHYLTVTVVFINDWTDIRCQLHYLLSTATKKSKFLKTIGLEIDGLDDSTISGSISSESPSTFVWCSPRELIHSISISAHNTSDLLEISRLSLSNCSYHTLYYRSILIWIHP